MSKKYMHTTHLCFNYILDYSVPPMTVEEYKACEAKFFDFLVVKVAKVEEPVGIFARLLQFVGISRSPAITDANDANQHPLNEVQGGGDKEEARSLWKAESRGHGDEVDLKTPTDLTASDLEMDMNTNKAVSYKDEATVDDKRDAQTVDNIGSVKDLDSCGSQILDEQHEDDHAVEKPKGKKKFWKSVRKFFSRSFKSCLKTEE